MAPTKKHQGLEWAQQIQAIAQNGLTYSQNEFDIERYHQLRTIAAQIMVTGFDFEASHILGEFNRQVGYATPKVDVRAAVFNADKILLVQEKEDGCWTLPGGWADVGVSPSECAIKEVHEESGYHVRIVKLLAVYDRNHPQPDRGFSECPKDVVVLADTLGLAKFSVLGVSSGGGYVFACAAKIPDRLFSAVVVSGAWDMDSLKDLPMFSRWIYTLSKTFPLLFEVVIKLSMRPFQGSSEKLLASLKKQLPAVDYALFQSPQKLQAIRESAIESMRQGTKSVTSDVLLYVHPWDFQAEEIQMPVQLFHGEQDTKVPISMARQVIDRLPTAQLFSYPDEGHISVGINQFTAIAHALKEKRSD